MRSFFNKPTWAAKEGNSPNEFYRRSQQTYSDIVAANREAHKKPKNPPEANESSSSSISNEVSNGSECLDVFDGQNTAPLTAPIVSPDEQGNLKENRPITTRLEQSPNAPVTPELTKGYEYPGIIPPGGSGSSSTDMPSVDHADHFATANSPANPSAHPPAYPPIRPEAQGQSDDKNRPALYSPSQPFQPADHLVEDPVVQVLITSEIPTTKPLVVHRKMSQSLGEVRSEWCKRQGFTTGTQSSVYLTWKGRRLFDVTTCRSLGIKPKKDTWALLHTDDDFDRGGKELQIHIVAVTDNPLLLNQPGYSTEVEPLPTTPPIPSNQQNEENEPMKLTLRSPGLGDLRIKARPKTLVSKLISTFRDKQNLSADQEVSLIFDGDRLDPSTCLGDHDIADLDLVDVQVKSCI
ncbi:hypothetical protein N7466_000005 [Penicillium verhagenii]|uniref:uncharacterized protein n=1 Tax=Penicillium verhagenii TaxID=1562060 RepID=UPI002545357E|nr:uncharacterized protein N7466_000005 [Penicillium verhagenii]KAJ5946990.1 hypothetical protein N7466_000005 [Penicillium verhagenii]